jgi:hypothetical protein
MQLSEIKPGMEIEYYSKFIRHGVKQGKGKVRKGIVRQVTPRLISVMGERYPDTILVNDLISGQAQIIKITKGEESMKKRGPARRPTQQADEFINIDIDWPPKNEAEKLLAEAIMNASCAVRRVLNDPVAVELMKKVLGVAK